MKKLILIIFTILVMTTQAWASTSWKVDDLYTFTLSVNGSSGAVDADSVPSYRVYEDETGTAILTGSMAKLDDTNTTGYYSEQLTLSAANGLEKGKSYNIIMCAAISSVTHCAMEAFQIEAEVDSNTVTGTVPTVTNITNDVGITQAGADKVWSTTLRVLTAGTNIALAKGTGVTGFNDLSAAQVESEATDALNAYDPPTRTEATADKDAILATTPTTGAKANIDAAYNGTGYCDGCIAVTVSSGAATPASPLVITETTIITVDNQFKGQTLRCGKQERFIAKTVDAANSIVVEPGNPFTGALSGTCYIK